VHYVLTHILHIKYNVGAIHSELYVGRQKTNIQAVSKGKTS